MRCAHRRRVPVEVLTALWSACWVERAVRCQLPPHSTGKHLGLLAETEPYAALWLRWDEGGTAEAVTLPDCPVPPLDTDADACCLYSGHPERHTWDVPAYSEEISCTS